MMVMIIVRVDFMSTHHVPGIVGGAHTCKSI